MTLTKEESSLLEIQEIDLKLAQVNERAEKAPHKQRIAATQAKIAEGKKRLTLIEAARADLEQKVSTLEAEVDELSQRMKSKQAEMQQSSDHRIVGNLSKELETLMKQKEKRENDGMKLMEKRSEFGEAHKDTTGKIEQLEAIEARELAAYKEYFAELKAAHDALKAKRESLMANVGKDNLAKYEAIRAAKNGIGVALYSYGKCGGCQVMVPAAKRAEIETAGGIVICPSCKRLLVVEK